VDVAGERRAFARLAQYEGRRGLARAELQRRPEHAAQRQPIRSAAPSRKGPNPVQSSRNGGFGFADFLLGMPNSGAIRQLMPISTQGLYYAVFVQDDWRVNDRLTLNLGLRWDLAVGDREKYNRIAYFDPNAPNPLGPKAGYRT
jgi:outer membrane receptor protein involved in Fe transport